MRLNLGVNGEDLKMQEWQGITRSFGVGEPLLESESDVAGKYIGFLTEGVAKMCLSSADGKERLVFFLHPVFTFGEVALMTARKIAPNLTITAVTPVKVFFVSKQNLLESMKKNPELANFVLQSSCEKMSTLISYLNGESFHDSLTMICEALLSLNEEAKEIRITHKELSEIIGKNRVTVSNILVKLQKMGAIIQKRNLIIVKDPDVLQNICDEKSPPFFAM